MAALVPCSLSLFWDSNPASLDIMSSLYHLCHHHYLTLCAYI